jgi:hypothetical protein
MNNEEKDCCANRSSIKQYLIYQRDQAQSQVTLQGYSGLWEKINHKVRLRCHFVQLGVYCHLVKLRRLMWAQHRLGRTETLMHPTGGRLRHLSLGKVWQFYTEHRGRLSGIL